MSLFAQVTVYVLATCTLPVLSQITTGAVVSDSSDENVSTCASICQSNCQMFCPTPTSAGPPTTSISFRTQEVTTDEAPSGLLTDEPVFSLIILALVAVLCMTTLIISFCIVHIRKKHERKQPWARESVRRTTVLSNPARANGANGGASA
ncbi:uncharacterized protein LOC135814750 [Sycon ciliatum]|uniref:uncharacterized protein LOC135814750 n=1 Tax=Sycon ciliatum TaxID=27933 RepID=UPI0020AC422B